MVGETALPERKEMMVPLMMFKKILEISNY